MALAVRDGHLAAYLDGERVGTLDDLRPATWAPRVQVGDVTGKPARGRFRNVRFHDLGTAAPGRLLPGGLGGTFVPNDGTGSLFPNPFQSRAGTQNN